MLAFHKRTLQAFRKMLQTAVDRDNSSAPSFFIPDPAANARSAAK
jgi:hypothetical protein